MYCVNHVNLKTQGLGLISTPIFSRRFLNPITLKYFQVRNVLFSLGSFCCGIKQSLQSIEAFTPLMDQSSTRTDHQGNRFSPIDLLPKDQSEKSLNDIRFRCIAIQKDKTTFDATNLATTEVGASTVTVSMTCHASV